MTLLHQLIATEKDYRRVEEANLTNAYHKAQKTALFFGLRKTYQPIAEEGTQLPGERQLIQATAGDVLNAAKEAMTNLVDFVASKDNTNRDAVADIVLADSVIAENVPVTTLLWLEKKLVDLRTLLAALPVLPTDDTWSWDADNTFYASEPQRTLRQVDKVGFETVAPATDRHPAQVVQVKTNVVEGTWTTVRHSAAIPAARRAELVSRVEDMIVATKVARERANTIEVKPMRIGTSIMSYLLR